MAKQMGNENVGQGQVFCTVSSVKNPGVDMQLLP